MTSLRLVPTIVIDLLNAKHAETPYAPLSKGKLTLDDVKTIPGIEDHFRMVAKALGFYFKDVEYILEFGVDKDGKLSVYTPCIKSVNDQAVLAWGKLVAPLKSLLLQPTFAGDSRVVCEYEFTQDGEDVVLEIPLRAKKDGAPLTRQAARTAYSKGTLASHLQEGFGSSSTGMATLEPGTYTIIGAKPAVGFKGALKYEVELKGLGTYAAPNKLLQKLTDLGHEGISESTPWTITLGALKSMTGSGGTPITYREVVHVGTSNLSALDLSQFHFSTEVREPSKLPLVASED
jgi:hypothetical protein